MIETKRILVVTELGQAGEEAIRAGAQRARASGAELAVVHTMPPLEMVRPLFAERVADDAVLQATLPEQLKEALARQVERCAADGPPATMFLESGATAQSTLDVAERWRADLIVTGAPERGAIDIDRIVRHAHTAVLVVRPGPATGPVVGCTDFSDPSLPAIRAAADEAARSGDPLWVVHALPPLPMAVIGGDGLGIVPTAGLHQARHDEAARRLAEALTSLGVAGAHAAVDGPVVPALVQAAKSKAARLLVVGTLGRTGIARFLLGSVAETLVREAPCSLLVVRLQR